MSMTKKMCRYDMLCFEGISLMLKIFQGQTESPNYRLVAPLDGKVQTITVKEEVRRNTAESNVKMMLIMEADIRNTPVYLWRHPEKYQAHTGEI